MDKIADDWAFVAGFFEKDDEAVTTEDRRQLFEACQRLDLGSQELANRYSQWRRTLPESEGSRACLQVLADLMSVPLLAPDDRLLI